MVRVHDESQPNRRPVEQPVVAPAQCWRSAHAVPAFGAFAGRCYARAIWDTFGR